MTMLVQRLGGVLLDTTQLATASNESCCVLAVVLYHIKLRLFAPKPWHYKTLLRLFCAIFKYIFNISLNLLATRSDLDATFFHS